MRRRSDGYEFEILVLDMVQMVEGKLAFGEMELGRVRVLATVKNLRGVDFGDSARKLMEKNGGVVEEFRGCWNCMI